MKKYRIEYRDPQGSKDEVIIEADSFTEAQVKFWRESEAGSYFESISEVPAKG